MTKLKDVVVTDAWKSLSDLSISVSVGDTIEFYNASRHNGANILVTENDTVPDNTTFYKTLKVGTSLTFKVASQAIYVKCDVDKALLMVSKIEV